MREILYWWNLLMQNLRDGLWRCSVGPTYNTYLLNRTHSSDTGEKNSTVKLLRLKRLLRRSLSWLCSRLFMLWFPQWRSQKNRRGVSELIVHNIKFNNSHKLKLNNDYITSNLIVLDETAYFESDVKCNNCIIQKLIWDSVVQVSLDILHRKEHSFNC